jgi:hypothetical protein
MDSKPKWQRIVEEAAEIPLEMIHRSISNYHRRLKMCIERDGQSVEIR